MKLFNSPLARGTLNCMAIGTVFTLLVIPALYVLIAKSHQGEAPGAIANDYAAHQHDEPEQPAPTRPIGQPEAVMAK